MFESGHYEGVWNANRLLVRRKGREAWTYAIPVRAGRLKKIAAAEAEFRRLTAKLEADIEEPATVVQPLTEQSQELSEQERWDTWKREFLTVTKNPNDAKAWRITLDHWRDWHQWHGNAETVAELALLFCRIRELEAENAALKEQAAGFDDPLFPRGVQQYCKQCGTAVSYHRAGFEFCSRQCADKDATRPNVPDHSDDTAGAPEPNLTD